MINNSVALEAVPQTKKEEEKKQAEQTKVIVEPAISYPSLNLGYKPMLEEIKNDLDKEDPFPPF